MGKASPGSAGGEENLSGVCSSSPGTGHREGLDQRKAGGQERLEQGKVGCQGKVGYQGKAGLGIGWRSGKSWVPEKAKSEKGRTRERLDQG